MKSKRNLMTVLVGLAMLATPITAAAKDHNHGAANFSRPAQARHFNAPARSFAPARIAPVREFAAHPNWAENHPGWARGYGYGHPGYYANRGYYNPGYVAPVAPYYAAPGYAGYGGGSGSCANARQVMTVYQQDRYSGHPAAAADLLRKNQWAFRSGCGGAGVGGNGGGLLNGFLGAPAYNNYGGGYGRPYGGNYGGGYNGGYNGGYGQPYGNGLGSLIQQYIR